MVVDIRPATLRDITFVAANMRGQDKREILATAKLDTLTEAGVISFHTSEDWCWIAWLDGQPVGAFGVAYGNPVYQPHIRHVWAYGTWRFKRVVPAISRFILREWPHRLLSEGVTRVECRSLIDHDLAHKWMTGLKAHKECDLLNYGVNGETFTQWAWLAQDWKE